MSAIPKLDENVLQSICDVLGDTGSGLTGAEIGKALSQAGIEDPDPSMTKRYRLFAALRQRQEKDECSNNVLAFVQRIMDPVLYVQNPEYFEDQRQRLNRILAFRGYMLGADGKIVKAQIANTLNEAHARANALQAKLAPRGVHSEVLKYCRAELTQENYFHAVFESVKGIAERIRDMSGLTTVGTALFATAFNVSSPFIAINRLQTETERSEQAGFSNLIKGVYGIFRNTTAHAPKIKWPIS